jgi:two-component system, cell cycle sensor histidine kinase and response regulator CckA
MDAGLAREGAAETGETTGQAISVAPCGTDNFVARYTILLVEDQTFVRRATAAVLRSCGYTVLTAIDGTQGLEACRDCPQPIDLLLSDMVIPGMSGSELAEAFRAIHPRGRVLLMSGYAEELPPYRSFPCRGPHLRKPFSIGTLINAVGEALDAGRLAPEISAGKP